MIVVNKTTIIPFTLYLTVVSVLHVELDTRGISILHIKDVMVIRKLDTPFRTLRNKDMDHKINLNLCSSQECFDACINERVYAGW